MDAEKLMMQRRIDNLIEQLEIVKRQRDALLKDLKNAHCCTFCKHDEASQALCELANCYCYECKLDCICKECADGSNFEWRGLCKENGGIEA